jgi:hypothetical protein
VVGCPQTERKDENISEKYVKECREINRRQATEDISVAGSEVRERDLERSLERGVENFERRIFVREEAKKRIP